MKAYILISNEISVVIAYVFFLSETQINILYFCSARWRHCKCQVCNCAALNWLIMASKVTRRLIASIDSTELGFCPCYSNSFF